ncbi:MAG: NAD-glutamate dehydrogenase, partial [Actinobacteria bacterium]|nr:NAD-glutamate dehydrogenase [Actinomycetota bacterium]
HLHEFRVVAPPDAVVDATESLTATVLAALDGRVDVDGLNQLVLRAGLTPHEVAIVRAYRRYRRQVGISYSAEYANPDQLQDGQALVVGVGNSGAEIALELARTRAVLLAGSDNGVIPFRPESVPARILMPIVGRFAFHRVLTTSTPLGRKARPKMVSSGEPLLRVKPKDLEGAGVERVGRVTGVEQGQPLLDDGRRIDVANVVWCTGFHPGFSWIDLPVFEAGQHEPSHHRGVVEAMPGLYFVGLKFLYSVSSEQIHGVGRDAAHIAAEIAARTATTHRTRQETERQHHLESA